MKAKMQKAQFVIGQEKDGEKETSYTYAIKAAVEASQHPEIGRQRQKTEDLKKTSIVLGSNFGQKIPTEA